MVPTASEQDEDSEQRPLSKEQASDDDLSVRFRKFREKRLADWSGQSVVGLQGWNDGSLTRWTVGIECPASCMALGVVTPLLALSSAECAGSFRVDWIDSSVSRPFHEKHE